MCRLSRSDAEGGAGRAFALLDVLRVHTLLWRVASLPAVAAMSGRAWSELELAADHLKVAKPVDLATEFHVERARKHLEDALLLLAAYAGSLPLYWTSTDEDAR